MIYDEGVEIRIGGKKYFAYFKYHMNTDGTCTSTCSETVNGYVATSAPGPFGPMRPRAGHIGAATSAQDSATSPSFVCHRCTHVPTRNTNARTGHDDPARTPR